MRHASKSPSKWTAWVETFSSDRRLFPAVLAEIADTHYGQLRAELLALGEKATPKTLADQVTRWAQRWEIDHTVAMVHRLTETVHAAT